MAKMAKKAGTPEEADEEIKRLEVELKQAKARKQKIDAERKKAEQELNRKNDERQKILIGACVLNDLKLGRMKSEDMLRWLNPYLTRPADRALFDLPPTSPSPAQSGV